jgi:hypothetical protein
MINVFKLSLFYTKLYVFYSTDFQAMKHKGEVITLKHYGVN